MTLFVKPNPLKTVDGEAVKVYDPERKNWLPTEGGHVPSNAYWVRRLADGDCIDGNAVVAIMADTGEEVMIDEKDIVPTASLTKAELQAFLKAQEIDFDPKANKAELIAIIENIGAKGE